MTEHSTLTNETPHSTYEITGMLMPARAFFFIVVDEPGKDGFLVRKIYASNSDSYLSKMDLSEAKMLSETISISRLIFKSIYIPPKFIQVRSFYISDLYLLKHYIRT